MGKLVLILLGIGLVALGVVYLMRVPQSDDTAEATSSPHVMDSARAVELVQWWGYDSKDLGYISEMKIDPQGGFVTKGSGAYFRYDPVQHRLLVSGLVGYNMKSLASDTESWQELLRAGEREKVTLGEGELEILTQKFFDNEPDVVLLTKSFTDGSITNEQFSREVRWLLAAAYHWFMFRFNAVMENPEQTLIDEAPKYVNSWPKRPW